MTETMTTNVKAHSTIGTILEVSEDGSTWEKLCPVKKYPALGGAPEQIKTTDLEDNSQTFVPGVQTMEAMEFTANYTYENYSAVNTKAGIPMHYRLKLAKNAGVAAWKGQHFVFVNEGEVNGVIEMTITVSPSTKIEISQPAV